MAWVDSEYAGALAVVAAWLSVLLPWSVSLRTGRLLGENASLVVVRFPFAMFQFLFGPEVRGFDTLVPMWAAPWFPADAPPGLADLTTVSNAYAVWLAGGTVLAVALALSLVYYARDEAVEAAAPVDPVRVMGALLAVGGGALLLATVVLFGPLAGLTAPIGAVIVPVLGAVLLRTERATVEE
jgi:uncharacterized protein (TIGR04206 family)